MITGILVNSMVVLFSGAGAALICSHKTNTTKMNAEKAKVDKERNEQ